MYYMRATSTKGCYHGIIHANHLILDLIQKYSNIIHTSPSLFVLTDKNTLFPRILFDQKQIEKHQYNLVCLTQFLYLSIR